MEKWLFKRNSDATGKYFTHYWTNEGENYPDVTDIEKYLDGFKNDYTWIRVDDLRLEKTTIDSFKIEVQSYELLDNKTIFMKLIDENAVIKNEKGEIIKKECPIYYYCNNIKATSDENYSVTSYQANLVIDNWATFGCKMHGFMKECKEKFVALRKMCNRFYKDKPEDSKYWLDYLWMPYLMQTGKYPTGLIRDKNENDITLDDWLYINSQMLSTKDDWLISWKAWEDKPYIGLINPNPNVGSGEKISPGDISKTTDVIETYAKDFYKYENPYVALCPYVKDDNYNANGRYRYLVCKIGSNAQVKRKIDSQDEYIQPTKVLDIIGAKISSDNEKLTEDKFYLNGETIMYIPFPKGIIENNFLRQLNDPSYGIVLGDGSILGMNLNDIPPSVLGLALRTYNENLTGDQQTIGDIYSFHNGTIKNTENVISSPVDISCLRLAGFAWDRNNPHKVGPAIRLNGPIWVSSTYAYYEITNNPNDGEYFYWEGNHGPEIHIRTYFWYEPQQQWLPNDMPPPEKDGYVQLFTTGSPSGTPAVGWTNWKKAAVFDSLDSKGQPNIVGEDGIAYIHKGHETEGVYIGEIVTEKDWKQMPVIFHDFSHIPVKLVSNKDNELYGNAYFFEELKRLLTVEYDKEGKEFKENKLENEPILYSPAFWQWVYYIDGLHKITLTADMIDFQQFKEDNWNIYINTNMASSTGYQLDIGKLKNPWYPFTKSTTELISTDNISYPYTTDPYVNWLQTHQATIETSKNAKDIDNRWAMKNLPFSQSGNVIGGLGAGAAAGAVLGPIGAIVGAAVGGLSGGMTALFDWIGLNNQIKQVDEQWTNDWNGTLQNIYSAPTSLNPSGFTSGSLIYSQNADAKKEYNLFKTFTITDIMKREIWNDISTNGYFYKSQCLYSDYLNRKNFNIVNFNFNDKQFYVDPYLRTKMAESGTMIFSQQIFIDWFKMKSKGLIRLFKEDFTTDNFYDTIRTNTEISYIIPDSIIKAIK